MRPCKVLNNFLCSCLRVCFALRAQKTRWPTEAQILSSRVVLRMQRLEPLTRHMGVDGGGGDVGMAK